MIPAEISELNEVYQHARRRFEISQRLVQSFVRMLRGPAEKYLDPVVRKKHLKSAEKFREEVIRRTRDVPDAVKTRFGDYLSV